MSLNKESNLYIFGYLAVMVIVVAVSLSLVSSALKEKIDGNEKMDKRRTILKSVLLEDEQQLSADLTGDNINKLYGNIQEMVVDYQGNPKEGVNAFSIKMKEELKKPEKDRSYPLYIYNDGTQKAYIIALVGLGLWDEISGYVSFDEDMNTIRSAVFDHKGETPGLGARIADYWFGAQFRGKKAYDPQGDYKLTILKGENNLAAKENPYDVDGCSGATITSTGTNNMLKNCIELYKPILQKIKSEGK